MRDVRTTLAAGTILSLIGAAGSSYFRGEDSKPSPIEESISVADTGYIPTAAIREESTENKKTVDLEGCIASTQLRKDASQLNRQGYNLKPEDLVYATRVLYWEGYGDPKAKTSKDMQKGLEAIASVILNRYEFDQLHNTNKFGGQQGVMGVVKRQGQFSCIRDRPSYFTQKSLHDQKNNPHLYASGMKRNGLDLAYNALIDILSKNKEDPTNSAVFYKTVYVQRQWHDVPAFSLKGHQFIRGNTANINSHRFYGLILHPRKR